MTPDITFVAGNAKCIEILSGERRIIVRLDSRPQVPVNVTFKADGSMEAEYVVGLEIVKTKPLHAAEPPKSQ